MFLEGNACRFDGVKISHYIYLFFFNFVGNSKILSLKFSDDYSRCDMGLISKCNYTNLLDSSENIVYGIIYGCVVINQYVKY